MTHFRVDVFRETGEVLLYMDMPCGAKPILGWPNSDGMKEFAQMLLKLCKNIEANKRTFDTSEEILTKALNEFNEEL